MSLGNLNIGECGKRTVDSIHSSSIAFGSNIVSSANFHATLAAAAKLDINQVGGIKKTFGLGTPS